MSTHDFRPVELHLAPSELKDMDVVARPVAPPPIRCELIDEGGDPLTDAMRAADPPTVLREPPRRWSSIARPPEFTT